MQYLAALGGGSCGMEHAILQTNCILEAFGNAKTSRNDNASRFVSSFVSFVLLQPVVIGLLCFQNHYWNLVIYFLMIAILFLPIS